MNFEHYLFLTNSNRKPSSSLDVKSDTISIQTNHSFQDRKVVIESSTPVPAKEAMAHIFS